jgi:hypothetical protein
MPAPAHALILVPLLILCAAVSLEAQTRGVPKALTSAAPEVKWDPNTRLRADLDCDGAPDQAFLGRAGGRVYIGVLRAGDPRPAILDFGISTGMQNAICAEPAVLALERLDYDPAEVVGALPEGFRRSKTCRGLDLSGGDCDSIHVFWNHKRGRFGWWRL